MDVRYVADNIRYQRMDTKELRDSYLVQNLFENNIITLLYVDIDRAIIGSAVPVKGDLKLEATKKQMAADYFTERREVGVINVGNKGSITVDGKKFELENRDVLYIGKESREILFSSEDSEEPAYFYIQSYPAHQVHPTQLIPFGQARKVDLGSKEEANERTIYQYIHLEGAKSCQLVMGFTQLAEGSIWNTMPAHTHMRRSEIYMYFGIDENNAVFHFMGEPDKTKHLVMRNRQAVISPSWSIHAGAGTKNYAFVWGMGGENQEFTDMDGVPLSEIL
ncbi:MAG: 5-dehydro-4-deoxy-D-glucuronate isomerase [Calditrichaeota bacterium]|nr:MAG: 5-dehydro-4-deoxy-D-glucuronate isomerase [Calditrichota bacterium]MBL1204753.1 5-dehydro-4-deoxy-D-glucuronate isomerase [Calditrichota bacterium]NOG44581.1 5-dehydro-4-deoxy-D-glucuronate isomerase [Calditrichota bacterium]